MTGGIDLNREKAAEFFGVDLRTIDLWLRRGCPGEKVKNRWAINSAAVVQWLQGRERAASEAVSETEAIDAAELRERIAIADLKELQRDEHAQRLVSVDAAASAWFTVTRTIRERMLGIPSLTAPQLAAMSDPIKIRAFLGQSIRDALTSLKDELPDTDTAEVA